MLEKRIHALEREFIGNIHQSETNIKDEIATGLFKGMTNLKKDEENHLKLLEMARRSNKNPTAILNQNYASNQPFDTGGDLIPQNLTEEEKQVLKIFYEKE